MRLFSIVFTVIALCISIYNATKINLEAPFKGESLIACITVLAGLCAIILVWILMISKRIQKLAQ